MNWPPLMFYERFCCQNVFFFIKRTLNEEIQIGTLSKKITIFDRYGIVVFLCSWYLFRLCFLGSLLDESIYHSHVR